MERIHGRSCVLIHCYKRGTPEWEHVMWGNLEKREFGRLTRGIDIALKEGAGLVYWGGGADAEPTYSFALERASILEKHFGCDVQDILKNRSYIGKGGSRTMLEIGEALALCQERALRRLILVSDTVHLDRCFKCKFTSRCPHQPYARTS